jgi:hypothetical protein
LKQADARPTRRTAALATVLAPAPLLLLLLLFMRRRLPPPILLLLPGRAATSLPASGRPFCSTATAAGTTATAVIAKIRPKPRLARLSPVLLAELRGRGGGASRGGGNVARCPCAVLMVARWLRPPPLWHCCCTRCHHERAAAAAVHHHLQKQNAWRPHGGGGGAAAAARSVARTLPLFNTPVAAVHALNPTPIRITLGDAFP